jgi:probable rRNA maturation factor
MPMTNEITVTSRNVTIYCEYIKSTPLKSLARDLELLAKIFDAFLMEMNSKEGLQWSLSINIVDSQTMLKINSEHRNKKYITDVLSFPMQESIRSHEIEYFNDRVEVGDIIVCNEVCEKQAREHDISFRDELIHLVIHGFLHLCGYDHDLNNDEEVLMESLENKLLSHFSKES